MQVTAGDGGQGDSPGSGELAEELDTDNLKLREEMNFSTPKDKFFKLLL